jgi:hypothetical protein
MIIHTEQDLRMLQGKFVIQVNNDKPDTELSESNWGFIKEKRLRIVSGLGFIDLYGQRNSYEDFETFKDVFNKYLFKHMVRNGETDGGRFHRLLTSKELSFLFEKIKDENY